MKYNRLYELDLFLGKSIFKYKVEYECLVSVVKLLHFCPACNKQGFKRNGVHFEHEWRCGDCDLSWEPGKSYLFVEWEENESY